MPKQHHWDIWGWSKTNHVWPECRHREFNSAAGQAEVSRLFVLLNEGWRSKSIGFPISCGTNPFTYFRYQMYLPPLVPNEIKKKVYWYLEVLVQIIEELHQLNIMFVWQWIGPLWF